MPTVTTTPTSLGTDAQLIQNLGPDSLYIGQSPAISAASGVRIAAGESVTMGAGNVNTYVVSGGTSDVRLLMRGGGIFSATETETGA